MSSLGRGLDLRVEELKAQNRQILEELFALRKACDNKDEEIAELRSKVRACEKERRTKGHRRDDEGMTKG